MKRIDVTELTIGSWCQIGHPANAEILAKAGFEWIAADCEHGEFEDGDIGNFCRAVRQFNCTPLVRVKENAIMPIRRALDLGAAGVIVPLVNTAAEAGQAVKAAQYPPKGIRGFAWQRGNSWGTDFDAYAKGFNPLVIVMIESKTAVDNIDAIMAVDGVDGCFIGPYDMSGSYGIPGQTGHQLIKDACIKVAEACKKHGKAAGQHIVVPTKENVAVALKQGYTFIALGMDTHFLGDGARKALELAKTS
jgi:2-keto-3-deoxy-L-rhamnonate aldolase RhmA